jgi:poly-gamma-glutamate capsule biosynthesis protein CapA/YwtB (metallophosphatase superfamily)
MNRHRIAASSLLVFMVCVHVLLAYDRKDLHATGSLPASFTADEHREYSLLFTGDIMPWDRMAGLLQQHGVSYPYANVLPLLQTADLTIGNLEGPVAVKARRKDYDYSYKVPPQTLPGLRDAGFDFMNLANNHSLDCGQEGLRETIAELRAAGIRHFGAGESAQAAAQPALFDLAGTRIALLGAICPETYFDDWEDAQQPGDYERLMMIMRERLGAGEERPGMIIATPWTVRQLVQRAARQADLVILNLHFGVRYQRAVTPRQRLLARCAVDAGADLVVGHHAHIWQPVELYRGVPIVYGLGNFAFGSGNSQAVEGMLLRVVLEKGAFSRLDFFPLYTRNRSSEVNYQAKAIAGVAAAKVIGQLAALSRPLGASIVFAEGYGRMSLPRRSNALATPKQNMPLQQP